MERTPDFEPHRRGMALTKLSLDLDSTAAQLCVAMEASVKGMYPARTTKHMDGFSRETR